MNIFTKFSDIEGDIRAKAPPVVYKYRTWKDVNHRKMLTRRELWFAHPFDLNDPIDLRPETVWDPSELDNPLFLEKLYNSAHEAHPQLNTDRERRAVAKKQWEILKGDPSKILQNRKAHEGERRNFDWYGVFSTATEGNISRMWNEYGDNNRGFCIGFKTVEICRNILGSYGLVKYDDAPNTYTFFKSDHQSDHEALYLKKKKWEHEKEFRFLTVGIGAYVPTRIQVYQSDAVDHINLGYDISAADRDAIITEIKNIWPKGVPIFKMHNGKGDTLEKGRIQ